MKKALHSNRGANLGVIWEAKSTQGYHIYVAISICNIRYLVSLFLRRGEEIAHARVENECTDYIDEEKPKGTYRERAVTRCKHPTVYQPGIGRICSLLRYASKTEEAINWNSLSNCHIQYLTSNEIM